jgi:aryl-alcohol dehydrogenase-like predicted oxidoreductase
MLPSVELRTLGASGLKVSAIGLGANTFGSTVDGDAAVAVIRRALDCGVTFIDTADVYSNGRSEELIAQAIEGRRHDVVLGTKVRSPMGETPYMQGLSRRWIMQAVEDSLRRLATDYIDLYQAHSPDDQTPIEETLRAMDDLVRQGKVRYLGCSNYAAWEMVRGIGVSQRAGLAQWVSVQPQWNLLDGLDDPHLLPACRALGVGIIPYRPLASGILTGKYRAGEKPPPGTRAGDLEGVRRRVTDEGLAAVDRLRPWAEERGRSTGDLAVAWLLAYPEVSTVIVGARTPEQAEQNVRAVDWKLTPAERDEVTALARGA